MITSRLFYLNVSHFVERMMLDLRPYNPVYHRAHPVYFVDRILETDSFCRLHLTYTHSLNGSIKYIIGQALKPC